MSRIKVNVVQKFKTYIIDGVSLEVYADGRIISKGIDISKNKPTAQGYKNIMINLRSYRQHRVIFSAWVEDILHDPTIFIDHIDGKSNALSNLRIATRPENGYNRSSNSNSKCGYKCISPSYSKKDHYWSWHICIRANKKSYARKFKAGDGFIPDILPPVPQYVIDVRDDMLKHYHGEFACLD